MKCKHLNGYLSTIMRLVHGTIVSNGKIIQGGDGEPIITHYEFLCVDCGETMRWKIGKEPQWVNQMIKYYEAISLEYYNDKTV